LHPLTGGNGCVELQLILLAVVVLLVPDAAPDDLLIAAQRGREVAPCPEVLPAELRRRSANSRATWIARFPSMYPTTCATPYFAGLEIVMCT